MGIADTGANCEFREHIWQGKHPKNSRPALVVAAIGLFVFTVLACIRVHVYTSKKECAYFNPEYADGDNIQVVQHHVIAGTLTTLLAIPIILGVEVTTSSPMFRSAALVFLVTGVIATVATVLPMGSFIKIRTLAGLGPTILALVWTLLWIVSMVFVVKHAIGCCMSTSKFGYQKWLFRSSMQGLFGVLLLPAFFSLRNYHAACTILLLVLYGTLIFLGEILAKYGVPPEDC